LSTDRALEGAERLALAMARTKTRTIRSPDHYSQETDSSSLDAFSILRDWNSAEVKSLLRRSIFDPATYGRVRFHHRSIQEFLAASRLQKLSAVGLTKRMLLSLLFADTYGERVVRGVRRDAGRPLRSDDRPSASERRTFHTARADTRVCPANGRRSHGDRGRLW